jgi:hypothetical protein
LIQGIPFDICDGQSGTGVGFPLSMLLLPCQYHSSHCSLLICIVILFLSQGHTGAVWKPSNNENNALNEGRELWTKKYINFTLERVNKLTILSLPYQTLPLIQLIAFDIQLVNTAAEGKIFVS